MGLGLVGPAAILMGLTGATWKGKSEIRLGTIWGLLALIGASLGREKSPLEGVPINYQPCDVVLFCSEGRLFADNVAPQP